MQYMLPKTCMVKGKPTINESQRSELFAVS